MAFDGTVRIDRPFVESVGLTGEALALAIEATQRKVASRVGAWCKGRAIPDVAGRPAVLVDDGVASGFTTRLAVEAVRRAGASSVAIAVPTGPLSSLEALSEVADVYCANVRTARRFSVADAYRNWHDETDASIGDLLAP